MEDNQISILIEVNSPTILNARECENCKCFGVLPFNIKWGAHKYYCCVKKGDTYCNIIQKHLDDIKPLEDREKLKLIEKGIIPRD